MQHLKYWSKIKSSIPEVVVEIGPGNSLGVGLAALLSGSKTYYALEKTQFWNVETNIRVFDELVAYFKMRKEVLDSSKFGCVPPSFKCCAPNPSNSPIIVLVRARH